MENIREEINKQGDRLTRQRLVILEYLRGVTCHPTAEQIHNEVKKQIANISLATVYRNLKYLVENGFIIQINTNDGKSHYDGNNRYHLHFICRECVRVFDIWQVGQSIAKKLQPFGQIEQIECNAYGVCRECLGRNAEKIGSDRR
ncbi:MAG: Peroxide operon regulator [bacterium ADurb.Bin400]|nr:MAG: Peroxide operon regulator [bacterium ADurb.Bin400]